MEKIRLSKLMSEQGICSRREADRYIELGWVFVDGVRISELGTKIYPAQKITLNKAAQVQQTGLVTIIAEQACRLCVRAAGAGLSARRGADQAGKSVYSQATGQAFQPAHLKNLAPAGRLDIDSQGLLVLTQDGRIAKQLIGEESRIEKEYLVRVEGGLPPAKLALLNHGLSLDGKALKPAQVSWQNQDQLRFILHEGKKRQIRRMCELVNLKVTGLKRVRIGKVKLGNLPEGQWRYLEDGEKF
jgi:23S rRNA pseudouridine2604 synthase